MLSLWDAASSKDLVGAGNRACKGCGGMIALRQMMKVLGPRTIVTTPASCMGTVGGNADMTIWSVPFYHTLFECAPAIASGIRAALDHQGLEDIHVVSCAGDAGTADIGLQSLSGTAERNERIIHLCYDNEMYMNTGGQTGSQTPKFSKTANSTLGKLSGKKDMLAIMAAHGIPYIACASIAYPEDFLSKLEKATQCGGFSYLHVLAPCPVGWKIESAQTIEAARLAVECGLWELCEIENGVRRRTYEPPLRPIRDYIEIQGRFDGITEDQLEWLQRETDRYYGTWCSAEGI